MPLDPRLRDALHSEATTVEPDVERHLDEVMARTGRRPSRMFGTLAIATAGVLLFAVVIRTLPADPLSVFQARPAIPAASPAADSSDVLAGTYRADFRVEDDGRSPGMTGEWTLTLGADSRVTAVPPDTFPASSDEPLRDYLYALREDELYTNLFARHLERSCVASGSYRWQLAGGRLTLALIADPCAPRVALLTSQPWELVADGSSQQ